MYVLNGYGPRQMYFHSQVVRDPKKIEKHCHTGPEIDLDRIPLLKLPPKKLTLNPYRYPLLNICFLVDTYFHTNKRHVYQQAM